MTQAHYWSGYYSQRGDTLLEVLICVLIFSFGLAGLATLQISIMQQGRETTAYNTAMQMGTALAEHMRANPQALAEGWYRNPTENSAGGCNPGLNCGLLAFVTAGLNYWQATLATRLPGATAHVCRDSSPIDGAAGAPECDDAGDYTIKIWWPEHGSGPQKYHLQAGLI
jgi:type IV pilus assembly protein PilV